MHCSLADWAKFVAETMRAAQGKPTLLSRETAGTLLTALPKQTYAGGWLLVERPWAGGQALTHAGSNTMWYCTAWIAPRKNVAYLVAVNAGGDAAATAADEAVGKLIEWDAAAK